MILDHVERFRNMTSSDFELIVCDDGSTDGTVEALRETGTTVITGPNRGVAWNKNRGLLYLNLFCSCDYVVLLDDDVYPNVDGWDLEWIAACERLGHVTAIPDKGWLFGGACTPESPGFSPYTFGNCLAFRRDVLASVGYFDPRFGKYGHEHTELTIRCIRAGYGGIKLNNSAGQHPCLTNGVNICFYVIDGGIGMATAPSNCNNESLMANASLLYELINEKIYRPGWLTDEDFFALRSEVTAARQLPPPSLSVIENFSPEEYLQANLDVFEAGVDPLAHYIHYGIAENRKLRP